MLEHKDAKKLWGAIVDYIEIDGELKAEGNSGEFHDDKAEKVLQKDEEKYRLELKNTFREVTGWWPVWHRIEKRWTKMIDGDL